MARATVEQFSIWLDVRDLARDGLLNGDHWSTSWGATALEVFAGSLSIRYMSGGELRRQEVPVDRTPCNRGGTRSWFRCPTPRCGRRCALLYLVEGRYACRRCHGLVYRTQHEHKDGRLLIKAERLWARLGWDFAEEGEKPKGMHWRTFQRIVDRANAAYEGSFSESRFMRSISKRMEQE
jgi:hypothetical protein